MLEVRELKRKYEVLKKEENISIKLFEGNEIVLSASEAYAIGEQLTKYANEIIDDACSNPIPQRIRMYMDCGKVMELKYSTVDSCRKVCKDEDTILFKVDAIDDNGLVVCSDYVNVKFYLPEDPRSAQQLKVFMDIDVMFVDWAPKCAGPERTIRLTSRQLVTGECLEPVLPTIEGPAKNPTNNWIEQHRIGNSHDQVMRA